MWRPFLALCSCRFYPLTGSHSDVEHLPACSTRDRSQVSHHPEVVECQLAHL